MPECGGLSRGRLEPTRPDRLNEEGREVAVVARGQALIRVLQATSTTDQYEMAVLAPEKLLLGIFTATSE
jgi:hypothetical protein